MTPTRRTRTCLIRAVDFTTPRRLRRPPRAERAGRRPGRRAATWSWLGTGTDAVPARVAERLVLLLRGRHRDPAAALHTLLVEVAALGALGVVAAELFRRVLLADFHPFALVVARAARDHHRQPQTGQDRRGARHSGRMVPRLGCSPARRTEPCPSPTPTASTSTTRRTPDRALAVQASARRGSLVLCPQGSSRPRRTADGRRGRPDEHVAHARTLEPDAAELIEPVAARDARRSRAGGIVHQDLVALAAGEHQEVPAGLGYRGANELPRAVGDGGDHGQALLETPRRRRPVGEPQEVAGDAVAPRGTDRRRPDAVAVEGGVEDLARERRDLHALAPVREDHRDAGGGADPHPNHRVGFHLAQRGHRKPRGAGGPRAGGSREATVPRREAHEPRRREGMPTVAADAQAHADRACGRLRHELVDLRSQPL